MIWLRKNLSNTKKRQTIFKVQKVRFRNKGEFENLRNISFRRSPPKVFLGKGFLKICSKFTGEHPCQSVVSIKLICKIIEIALRHGFPAVDLLHISRTSFYKNTSRGLLLFLQKMLLKKKSSYFEEKLVPNSRNPIELWWTLKSLGLMLRKGIRQKFFSIKMVQSSLSLTKMQTILKSSTTN